MGILDLCIIQVDVLQTAGIVATQEPRAVTRHVVQHVEVGTRDGAYHLQFAVLGVVASDSIDSRVSSCGLIDIDGQS